MNVVKDTETIAMFIGSMGAGKSREVLRLLENEYMHYFEMVVFICPTITINSTYIECEFLWKDPGIYTIKPEDNLIKWVNAISQKTIGRKTLFILDDCIGKEDLDKTRGELCELAIEIRHRKHSLWFLTQTYVGIPKKFRRLVNMTFLWFLKDKNDQKHVADENNFIDDWPAIFKKLRDSESKHCFAYIRGDKPFSVQIKDDSDNKRSQSCREREKRLGKTAGKN